MKILPPLKLKHTRQRGRPPKEIHNVEEVVVDSQAQRKKPRASKKKVVVDLGDEEDDGKGKGKWKDLWVNQLIHIRGAMNEEFNNPLKQEVNIWAKVATQLAATYQDFDKDSEGCRKKFKMLLLLVLCFITFAFVLANLLIWNGSEKQILNSHALCLAEEVQRSAATYIMELHVIRQVETEDAMECAQRGKDSAADLGLSPERCDNLARAMYREQTRANLAKMFGDQALADMDSSSSSSA
ncbi:hypothetical protein L7F22_060539 [Adiantum nelumboides]|nr:hypothetical protein [Adiantum nelumboides]